MTSDTLTAIAEAIRTLEPPSPEEFDIPTISDVACSTAATKFGVDLWRFMAAVQTLQGGEDLVKESAIVEEFIELDLMRNDALAHERHAYMAFRAEFEGKPHRRDVNYYSGVLLNQRKASLRKRIGGIRIGDHSLLSDTKNPTAFQAWHASRRHRALSQRGRKRRGTRSAAVQCMKSSRGKI